jgi:hypothetical protein
MKATIRKASAVHAALKEVVVGSDTRIIALKNCVIQIPSRFAQVGLAQIGTKTFIYGIYAIILETGEYAVSNINAMVQISPSRIMSIDIGGVPYYEFYFLAGDTVVVNTTLVRQKMLIYNVFDELIFKGKIPWYLEYDDVGKLFDTASRHGDSPVARNYEVIELIASMVARAPHDRTKYYRESVIDIDYLNTNPAVFVAMNSVFYSVTNTLNKISGNYYSDGVISALVNPSETTEHVETLLRS